MTTEIPTNDELRAEVVAELNAAVPELMGATEVARELEVSRTNLAKVVDLPAPCQELYRGRVWRADVIRHFAKLRDERNAAPGAVGGPRKSTRVDSGT